MLKEKLRRGYELMTQIPINASQYYIAANKRNYAQ